MKNDETNRRYFLKKATLMAAIPLTGNHQATAPAKVVNKAAIQDVRAIVLADRFVLVQILTDQGVVGFGECSPMNPAVTVPIIQVIRDIIKGEDALQIEKLWEKMQIQTYKLEGRAVAIALSGVDIALWDILGKIAGLPVHQLLGGAYRNEIPVYSTLFREASPENMARRAAAAVAAGFTTVKAQVATRWGFDAQPDTTVKVIESIRKAIGDGPDIVVDANSGWSVPTAVRRCKEIEPYRIAWLEQPTPERDLAAVAHISHSTSIPVGFGEEEWSLWRYKDALISRAAEILQPDPIKSAGITGCKKVAVLTEAFSKAFTPHNTSSGLGMAATLHLVASTPTARSPQECTIVPDEVKAGGQSQGKNKQSEWMFAPKSEDEEVIRKHLLTEPFKVNKSHLSVPQKAGLGVKLNPEVVKKFAAGKVDITAGM
jgi:L-alanine-DL-glutamate epimerase-like enolase superfamily enzyme